jgi:release factor glutamine methyltransferase
MSTVDEALAAARSLGLPRLDATVLLAHHLHTRREWLITHPDAQVDPGAMVRFHADCLRRADDVPLAYLTGRREFRGLDLRIDPSVLVPRPETEMLADWAIERLRAMPSAPPRPRVVDLGTGSGALALAIAAACPEAEVVGIDASARALAVARSNANRLGLQLRFVQGDWWQAVDAERFDVAVANPPYVAPGDPHLPALRHEPQDALVAADGGLAALRHIIERAPAHVSGWLLLEHGWTQADAVQHLLSASGFQAIETRQDLHGQPRCSGGRLG